VPDDESFTPHHDDEPAGARTPPTPAVEDSPPPSPRPLRQRSMARLRPVSIPDMVRDIAGKDAIRAMGDFFSHCMPLHEKVSYSIPTHVQRTIPCYASPADSHISTGPARNCLVKARILGKRWSLSSAAPPRLVQHTHAMARRRRGRALPCRTAGSGRRSLRVGGGAAPLISL
jgi:hypothetical protein